MSRGSLSEYESRSIENELPNLSKLEDILLISPDALAMTSAFSTACSYTSNLPTAITCFKEALDALRAARYALHEVSAHQIWYLDEAKPSNPEAAVFFGRFYADDAAFRLYSAGEHLSNGIVMMLGITEENLKPYKAPSRRSKLTKYLSEEKSNDEITRVMLNLYKFEEWKKAMTYRNRVVHDQPPLIDGMGIVYRRRARWTLMPDGTHQLQFGGDKPEYTVAELLGFLKPALLQFTDALTKVVNLYIKLWQDMAEKSGEFIFNGDMI